MYKLNICFKDSSSSYYHKYIPCNSNQFKIEQYSSSSCSGSYTIIYKTLKEYSYSYSNTLPDHIVYRVYCIDSNCNTINKARILLYASGCRSDGYTSYYDKHTIENGYHYYRYSTSSTCSSSNPTTYYYPCNKASNTFIDYCCSYSEGSNCTNSDDGGDNEIVCSYTETYWRYQVGEYRYDSDITTSVLKYNICFQTKTDNYYHKYAGCNYHYYKHYKYSTSDCSGNPISVTYESKEKGDVYYYDYQKLPSHIGYKMDCLNNDCDKKNEAHITLFTENCHYDAEKQKRTNSILKNNLMMVYYYSDDRCYGTVTSTSSYSCDTIYNSIFYVSCVKYNETTPNQPGTGENPGTSDEDNFNQICQRDSGYTSIPYLRKESNGMPMFIVLNKCFEYNSYGWKYQPCNGNQYVFERYESKTCSGYPIQRLSIPLYDGKNKFEYLESLPSHQAYVIYANEASCTNMNETFVTILANECIVVDKKYNIYSQMTISDSQFTIKYFKDISCQRTYNGFDYSETTLNCEQCLKDKEGRSLKMYCHQYGIDNGTISISSLFMILILFILLF